MRNILFCVRVSLFVFAITTHAATFIVSNNSDAGANTLRQAIVDANTSPGADIINFNFAGATTITLTACQTPITGPVTIDGYSNPGSGAGNILIEVISPAGCRGFDFAAGSDGSIIRGIAISGGATGIYLQSSHGHTVAGNYVGTNRLGTAVAASRPQNGIHANASNNNTIGGTGGQIDRNVVSGNSQSGIRIQGSTGNVVINNYVGVSVTGNAAIANSEHGVYAYDLSANLRVGGTTTAERNVISGNTSQGIYMYNSASPVIKGNIIGMGANGTTMLGNGASGINGEFVSNAQIGGLTPEERNYISCNGSFGAVVRNSPNSVFEGNWIGVDMATGLLDYGNYDAAITATNSADVRVGGSVAGSGNVLSASGNPGGGADGISIWSTSPRPIIKGNIIGLGVDGITPLQNYGHGIECLTCDDGIIGGPTLLERNLVAMSLNRGLQLVNSPRITVINNYIGTDITGMLDRGNLEMGISVSNSANVVIGGATANTGNVISGNTGSGIEIDGTSPGTIVKGNYIGLGSDGTTSLRNDLFGVKIAGNASNNCVIGGATVLERNLISSNGVNTSHHGIFIGGTTTGHSIVNNYIGTDVSGSIARGNTGQGMYINQSSTLTITDNIIAANGSKGIEFAASSTNSILRNKIGTDISGNLNFGNGGEGIRFSSTSLNNIVGASIADANIIANNNTGAGVWLEPNAQRNTITFNSIFCNVGLGIDLESTANESVLPPGILSSTANSINGTGVTNNIIHVYRNTRADGGVKCNCEGEIYIGTTVVAGGTWSITHNLGLSAAEASYVTATQTTTNGSTSEFTPCSTPLPVTLTSFIATKENDRTVSLHWSTTYEQNNSRFEIQRSGDGEHFETIGTQAGAGNSAIRKVYLFNDTEPLEGVNYYRLKQVDFSGKITFSSIVMTDLSEVELSVFATQQGFTIVSPGKEDREIHYRVYTLAGSMVEDQTVLVPAGIIRFSVSLNLNKAIYLVVASNKVETVSQKIMLSE